VGPCCVEIGGVAEFRLYDGATTRLLGAHRSLEAAYAAADEHALDALAHTRRGRRSSASIFGR
jgi:hypothetical protein